MSLVTVGHSQLEKSQVRRRCLLEIRVEASQVIIAIPNAILILTKAQFIEALRRGKAYRRQRVLEARQPRPQEERP
jgi:hypothetical protein